MYSVNTPPSSKSVAENLCVMAKDYKSSDPAQATSFKLAFKDRSKNDLVRAVVYLLEVVGSRDQQFKAIQQENADLKELLKLNNIDIEDKEGTPVVSSDAPTETAAP